MRNAWGGTTFLFHQLLARHGIALLQVDNRGMGARGQKFAAALRLQPDGAERQCCTAGRLAEERASTA